VRHLHNVHSQGTSIALLSFEVTIMARPKTQHDWSSFLNFFTETNRSRPTRLGVFEGGNDFWLESGLPFTGIDIEMYQDAPQIQIVLGDYTHVINRVNELRIILRRSGEEDGLDIVDDLGKTTILRFEVG